MVPLVFQQLPSWAARIVWEDLPILKPNINSKINNDNWTEWSAIQA